MVESKLRFPEFDDEWGEDTFKNIFTTLQNNTFSRKEMNYDNGKIKNIHYGDVLVKYKEILDVNKQAIPYINDDLSVKNFKLESYLKDGDVIIADTAEDYTVGKAVEIVNLGNNKILSGLHTIACRPQKKFAKGFLGYYINSSSYHNQLLPLVTGIKVSGISKSSIENTVLKYPCIEEQNKIANFLSKIDKYITAQESTVQLLEEEKKGLMQKIFSQNIRFKDDDGNEYEYWIVKKLGDVANCYQPKTISKEDCIENGKYEVFGANGIIGRYDKYNHELEQIAISCRGENSGIVNYIKKQSWITGNSMVINIDNNKNIFKKFLFYELSYQNLKYMVTGSGQPQIVGKDLSIHKIKIPCIEEQEKIANCISKMDELLENEKQILDQWKLLKKGLLQQMFVSEKKEKLQLAFAEE